MVPLSKRFPRHQLGCEDLRKLGLSEARWGPVEPAIYAPAAHDWALSALGLNTQASWPRQSRFRQRVSRFAPGALPLPADALEHDERRAQDDRDLGSQERAEILERGAVGEVVEQLHAHVVGE